MLRHAALLFAALVGGLSAAAADDLQLMTYNIRLDIESDGPNRWENRKAQLAAQIETLSPDILGIQEGLPHQVDYLQEQLAGYAFVGVGRDDGQRAGEFSALFYRPEETDLLESNTFWLSDTPDQPSFGWGAQYRRICTYGRFRDRRTKQTYWIFNTHLDHQVPAARLNGIELILERISRLVPPGEPHFLMGDLNATPDAPPIQRLSQSLRDSRRHSHGPIFGPEATFNGFDPTAAPARRIDYIFASPNARILSYSVHNDAIDGRFPSDHFPVIATADIPLAAPHLKVSENRRHLADSRGEPFFWLADTAWELFHRLDRDQALRYLDTRQAQGFNVVQAVVLAEQDGLNVPNPYGHLPLVDQDPTRPNDAYFEHVDDIVHAANARGLVVALLPTWGDKFNRKWGVGPEIFTESNAESFAAYLARRYGENSIVWVLGGDRSPETDLHYRIVRAMARGIRSVVGDSQLITYHPQGRRSSSDFFHQDAWLDFNMHQSSHGDRAYPNFNDTLADLQLSPTKPVLDAEPNYEDIPVGFDVNNGWFDAFDSRRAGYWSVLAGAFGHTYGHHGVWQMWTPQRHPVLSVRTPWQEAIHYPGAHQAGYMRKGFESLPWQRLRPEQDLLASGPTETAKTVRVAATDDLSHLLAYAPFGSTFSLDLPRGYARARWFNPRDGSSIPIDAPPTAPGIAAFDPPFDEERANDWLLILSQP